MVNSLRFHPLVADNLSAATAWNDNVSIDLGNRFRVDVSDRLDAVELWPESFALVDVALRAAMCHVYPLRSVGSCSS